MLNFYYIDSIVKLEYFLYTNLKKVISGYFVKKLFVKPL